MTNPLNNDEEMLDSRDKERWEEPKLTFVNPKLTKHGGVDELTGGFFGGFSP